MAKLIIFGTGTLAQLVKYYFENDSSHRIVAFTVDKAFLNSDNIDNLPILPFEDIENYFPPNEYNMFIAIGYKQMNKIREKKFNEAKKKGYKLISYINSHTKYLSQYNCGENCFIFEGNIIQPYTIIKDNVLIWSNNFIGHHSIINNHNFIASQVAINGFCEIESNSFIGANSTIIDHIRIAEGTLVGAGSVITKNTEPYSVYVPSKSIKLNKKSLDFNL